MSGTRTAAARSAGLPGYGATQRDRPATTGTEWSRREHYHGSRPPHSVFPGIHSFPGEIGGSECQWHMTWVTHMGKSGAHSLRAPEEGYP
ncbi:hypothetical protein GCM10009738_49190 [Kitasatospora viridis]